VKAHFINKEKILNFELNKRNNITELQQKYSDNQYVRINNFLSPQSIELLVQAVTQRINFKNAFFLGGKNREASDKDIACLGAEQRKALYSEIYQAAAKGSGFLYGRNKIELSESALPETRAVLELMNSEHVLTMIKKITGSAAINYADGQVTRFRVGDFLTRHIDSVPGETRQFAYVLNLNQNWHPDWGGLLQFFEKSGTPQNALSPVFNSLTLFDVNKVHSVTSIAPFAPTDRLSITGWFRE
jgi:Rps23 Pro-64 3,4-dihydroxylase Tpa1-like proline 4-hydroxylase